MIDAITKFPVRHINVLHEISKNKYENDDNYDEQKYQFNFALDKLQ